MVSIGLVSFQGTPRVSVCQSIFCRPRACPEVDSSDQQDQEVEGIRMTKRRRKRMRQVQIQEPETDVDIEVQRLFPAAPPSSSLRLVFDRDICATTHKQTIT